MDVETRQTAWTIWVAFLYWLNGLAFVLLGLQLPGLFRSVTAHYPTGAVLGMMFAIAAATMAFRIVGVFPGIGLPSVLSRGRRPAGETAPTGREMIVAGWAGIRGAVTLAAALSIPLTLPDGSPFPGREIVIFMAGGVVIVTLVLQGTTLEWLIRRLGLREDDTARNEEHLARRAAVGAGLQVLRDLQTATPAPGEADALRHVIIEYERRLSELVAEGESQVTARRMRAAEKRFRLAALEAERHALDGLWREDAITDDIHRPLQQLLDHEESMLRAHPTHQQ
jgi:CPA1 family monovalent cation:H+ antiporter